MQLLHELGGERGRVDGHGPARQVDVQVLPHLDLEVAAVEVDGHRAVRAADDRGDRRAARAGARGHGLPHPALEYAGADLPLAVAAPEGDVRAVREELVALDGRPVAGQVELLEPLGDLDRALWIPHGDV